MRLIKTSLITAGITILLTNGGVLAGGTHSDSHHDATTQQGVERQADMGTDHADMGGHQHDSWEKPPKSYASLVSNNWNDSASAKRGEQLYQQQCIACHGADGKGAGPAAAGLEHPPADLTNHFHTAPGQGDGYLFWRISEGGAVEPFRSMKSAMPSFKSSLSETQRWEVLTYIHQSFHGDFTQALPHSDTQTKQGEQNHDPSHKH